MKKVRDRIKRYKAELARLNGRLSGAASLADRHAIHSEMARTAFKMNRLARMHGIAVR